MNATQPIGSRPASRTRNPIRSILTAAAMFASAIALAVAASGGSYALWNGQVSPGAATLSSGTIGLTVNDVTAHSVPLTTTQLLPGRSVVPAAPLVLKNTGAVPLLVTADSIAFANPSSALNAHLLISMRVATSATCTVTPEATPLPTVIAPISLAIGQSVPLCIEVRLSSTAPATVQGLSSTFTINLTGTQVRP